eukprot:scaffold1939_cov63-Phaeocystis_antarctica.AAC.2
MHLDVISHNLRSGAAPPRHAARAATRAPRCLRWSARLTPLASAAVPLQVSSAPSRLLVMEATTQRRSRLHLAPPTRSADHAPRSGCATSRRAVRRCSWQDAWVGLGLGLGVRVRVKVRARARARVRGSWQRASRSAHASIQLARARRQSRAGRRATAAATRRCSVPASRHARRARASARPLACRSRASSRPVA